MVDRRVSWGEKRLYYYDAERHLAYIPESWTDLAPQDPFDVLSAGSVCFRVDDLLRLVALVEALAEDREEAEC